MPPRRESGRRGLDSLRNWLILATFVAALIACSKRADEQVSPAPRVTEAPRTELRGREQLVGSASCAECHRAQSDAYQSSHHAQALVKPSPARFANSSSFTTPLGGATNFSLRDGAPFVDDYPVRYVAGVWPLEQYVVETERGKLQSLGVAWNTRDSKWFHVYGADGVAPHDSLFFTGAAQNWNQICADCHSTWVERRYDADADRFDTRWAEQAVGCEACHGPGAEHVRSARAGKPSPFVTRLTRSEPWRPSATGSPTPRPPDPREDETCAPCHARRLPLKEGFVASDPFLDSFEPDLLRPDRYHADGQVEGEVFEWGSFQQSRMHHAGVKCSDCHEPHSGKPLAQGNALCVRCHEPTRFDVKEHSRHAEARAPQCVDCHMPRTTFMQVHERRDHSIRIPRPDHSVAFGTPNACNKCHTNKPAAWARDAVAQWAPASQQKPHFVEALAADRRGQLDAPRRLRELAQSESFPAIARATALERLGSYGSIRALRNALTSAEPLIVYGAVRGAAQLPPPQRAALLVPALRHARRAVRVAAAKALAGVPVPADAQPALDRAFTEAEQAFDVSASRPETQVERSAFELARGKLAEAERSLQRALRLDSCFVEAHLNLAELHRQRGDEAASGRAIGAALDCNPKSAPAHHALGLWQVRAKQPALGSLKKAVELLPGDPRFSYVLAVALAGAGDRAGAIRVLEAASKRRPNDVSVLQALATYLPPEKADAVRKQLEQLMRE